METIIRNKKATSYLKLKDLGDKKSLQVKIVTSKTHNGYLTSSVSVNTIEQMEGYATESFVMFQDYSKRIKAFTDVKRVTDKAVELAHAEALKLFNEGQYMQEINAQYGV